MEEEPHAEKVRSKMYGVGTEKADAMVLVTEWGLRKRAQGGAAEKSVVMVVLVDMI